jgi:ureidoacrylate peracid hydrolase
MTYKDKRVSNVTQLPPDILRSAALIAVDMQNGFCHSDGSVAKRFDIAGYRAPIPNIARLADAARAAGLPIIWSRQEHTEFDAGRLGHRLANHTAKLRYVPCLRGTWDAEILDELKPHVGPEDLDLVKHRASCFYNTILETELRMRGVDTLIVTGVATNYCVEATIRDAYARDLDVLVVEDACGCAWPDLHAATIRNVELFHGTVVSSDDIVAALANHQHEQGKTP